MHSDVCETTLDWAWALKSASVRTGLPMSSAARVGQLILHGDAYQVLPLLVAAARLAPAGPIEWCCDAEALTAAGSQSVLLVVQVDAAGAVGAVAAEYVDADGSAARCEWLPLSTGVFGTAAQVGRWLGELARLVASPPAYAPADVDTVLPLLAWLTPEVVIHSDEKGDGPR